MFTVKGLWEITGPGMLGSRNNSLYLWLLKQVTIFINTKLLMRINSIRSDPKQAKDRNGYFPLCQMEESQLVKISITLQM